MSSDLAPGRAQTRDLVTWLGLAGLGIAVCWLAVVLDARIGTSSPPFGGRFTPYPDRAALLALPLASLVAATVLVCAYRGGFERLPWRTTVLVSYLASLAWTVALAFGDGRDGLTAPLHDPEGAAADAAAIGDDPLGWLRRYTADGPGHSGYSQGHPPGAALLLWVTQRIGLTHDLALGLLLAAGAALTVPLVLLTVRDACDELTARRYLPVLALAPYALWAVHPDVLVATLGAAMILAAGWATRRRAWRAALGGLGAGMLLGVTAMFAYAAAWFGLSVIFLYFARRRPLLNLLTGAGALIPVLLARLLGFNWVTGLVSARADFAERVEPHRAAGWWAALSLVVLLLVTGPALVASLRKLRNTPGWPFLLGAGLAIGFAVLAGFARGGAEHAWLAFFPWLTVAAVAPARQGGAAAPTPVLLTAAGAVTALALSLLLSG